MATVVKGVVVTSGIAIIKSFLEVGLQGRLRNNGNVSPPVTSNQLSDVPPTGGSAVPEFIRDSPPQEPPVTRSSISMALTYPQPAVYRFSS